MRDLEVLIVGDGVGPASRERYLAWQADDPRVRFFDYPKHPRRGEPYRHELLMEHARGRIVLYCCDRDLWFAHHVATLARALERADFANTLSMRVHPDGTILAPRLVDLRRPDERVSFTKGALGLPLSVVGHTLAAYRALPEGWTTTPEGHYTDVFMWRKFLRHAAVRATTIPLPTLLYFNRGAHPGWPVAQRRDELRRWMPRVTHGYTECLEAYCAVLWAAGPALARPPSWLRRRAAAIWGRARPAAPAAR